MKLQLIIVFGLIIKSCVSDTLDCNDRDNKNIQLKLKKSIICDYDKYISPSERIDMLFNVNLVHFQFSDNTRTMTIQIWLTLMWSDNRLAWKPEDHDDLELTFVPFDMLWVPDVTLFRRNVLEDINSCTVTDCNIFFNGTVQCLQPCEFSIYCDDADYTSWPFDYSACAFQFMSRTKTTQKLNFYKTTALSIDTDGTANNRVWDLTSYSYMIFNQTNGMSLNPNAVYSCVMLRFIIDRHNKELILQLIIPAALLIFMNFFTLLLDPSMPERWILYTIYLFSHLISHEQLSWMFPIHSDSTPNVFNYYCYSYYITLFLMIETLLMKAFVESVDSSQWIIVFIDKATKSYLGRFIMKNESEGTEKSNIKKEFSDFIDRLLVIMLILFYGYTFTALMPRKGMDKTPSEAIFESVY